MKLSLLVERLKRLKGPIAAIAAGGAILSGLVGYYTTYKTVAGVAAPGPSASAPSIQALSIIVLPLLNQTGDASKAYIADALTSSITADLARIREALVIGVATANTYKDKPVPLQQLGRELGVRFVLQGSVLVEGQRLRVDAQLADTQSQATLWSERFEGDSMQLFALQEAVTARIANSIGREIVVIAARESSKRSTTLRAADLMLRALALRAQPRSLENERALESLYRQVIRLEPNNDDAMGRLARALWVQGRVFADDLGAASAEAKVAEAYRLANEALKLNPNSVFALQIRSRELGDHGDLAGRLRYLEAALALEPTNAVVLGNLSVLMNDLGRHAEAIDYATRSLQLDPKSPLRHLPMTSLGEAYRFLGKPEAAVEWLSKAVADNSPEWAIRVELALAYAQLGQDAMAQRTWAEYLQRRPNFDFAKQWRPDASALEHERRQFEQVDLPLARKMGWVKSP